MQKQDLENKEIKMQEKVHGSDFNQVEQKKIIQKMTRQIEEGHQKEKSLQERVKDMQQEINFCQ